jgi:hypothetical protein
MGRGQSLKKYDPKFGWQTRAESEKAKLFKTITNPHRGGVHHIYDTPGERFTVETTKIVVNFHPISYTYEEDPPPYKCEDHVMPIDRDWQYDSMRHRQDMHPHRFIQHRLLDTFAKVCHEEVWGDVHNAYLAEHLLEPGATPLYARELKYCLDDTDFHNFDFPKHHVVLLTKKEKLKVVAFRTVRPNKYSLCKINLAKQLRHYQVLLPSLFVNNCPPHILVSKPDSWPLEYKDMLAQCLGIRPQYRRDRFYHHGFYKFVNEVMEGRQSLMDLMQGKCRFGNVLTNFDPHNCETLSGFCEPLHPYNGPITYENTARKFIHQDS